VAVPGFKRMVFWLHLTCGVVAGTVILVMSVTGVLLSFEPQLVERAERDLWRAAPPSIDASRLPLAAVVAGAQAGAGSERATTVTLCPDPPAPARSTGARSISTSRSAGARPSA